MENLYELAKIAHLDSTTKINISDTKMYKFNEESSESYPRDEKIKASSPGEPYYYRAHGNSNILKLTIAGIGKVHLRTKIETTKKNNDTFLSRLLTNNYYHYTHRVYYILSSDEKSIIISLDDGNKLFEHYLSVIDNAQKEKLKKFDEQINNRIVNIKTQ